VKFKPNDKVRIVIENSNNLRKVGEIGVIAFNSNEEFSIRMKNHCDYLVEFDIYNCGYHDWFQERELELVGENNSKGAI
jgi:hypothetical protein